MSGIYHMNGIPAAYSTIAEDVQKGRDAKISHLLAQVFQFCSFSYRVPTIPGTTSFEQLSYQ